MVETSSRSRTILVLAAVAAVVIALGVVAYIVAGGGDDDDSGASATTLPDGTVGETPGAAIDPLDATVTVSGDSLVPLEDPAADPAVGRAAPALSGTNYDGAKTELRPGSDGPTLAVFLAHWCPHCNDEIPVLNEWRDSGEIPENLRIVGVSTGVSEERPNYPPGEWLEEMDWQWDVIADSPEGRAAEAYGVSAYPFFTLIDEDGNVAARGSGQLPIEDLSALVATVAG